MHHHTIFNRPLPRQLNTSKAAARIFQPLIHNARADKLPAMAFRHVIPQPSYLSPSVLENDGLAIEGLKWFNRSQTHAALKFSQALQALMFGNFTQAQSLRKEGCGQYNESTVALGASAFPANVQPVGFINSTLINDMMTALKATAAVVCP
ncbi:hypothetical protein EBR21_16370 [bacterium]|nr:hypothetical protein [bacterium]